MQRAAVCLVEFILQYLEELQTSIQKRFSVYIENKFMCLSSLLDPRFKMKKKKRYGRGNKKMANSIENLDKS